MSTGLLEKENRGPEKWILEQFSHFSTRNPKCSPRSQCRKKEGDGEGTDAERAALGLAQRTSQAG